MYAGNCLRVYYGVFYRQEGEKQMFKKLNKMKIGVRLKKSFRQIIMI